MYMTKEILEFNMSEDFRSMRLSNEFYFNLINALKAISEYKEGKIDLDALNARANDICLQIGLPSGIDSSFFEKLIVTANKSDVN